MRIARRCAPSWSVISARHWATPSLLLGAGLALERWSGDDHVVAGRVTVTRALERLELRGDVEGWLAEGGLLGRSTFGAFVATHEREAMLSLARGDSGWVLSAKVVSRP